MTLTAQSGSQNMVTYVTYGFLLLCYSYFVRRMHCFFRYSTSKNVVNLKTGLRIREDH